MTTSSAISFFALGSSSRILTSLCRSTTSSNKSKNLVNFSFAEPLLDLSLGSSVIACISGEKLEAKYPALAVRKAEFRASEVTGEMRLRTASSVGSKRIFCRRYEMLLRRKMEPNEGRRPFREMLFRLDIAVATRSSIHSVQCRYWLLGNCKTYRGNVPGYYHRHLPCCLSLLEYLHPFSNYRHRVHGEQLQRHSALEVFV